MTNVISFTSPISARAIVLAELLRQMAGSASSIRAVDLFAATRSSLGLSETDAGPALWSGIFLLIRSGLLDCSHYDSVKSEIAIGNTTTVEASSRLRSFALGDWTNSSDEPAGAA